MSGPQTAARDHCRQRRGLTVTQNWGCRPLRGAVRPRARWLARLPLSTTVDIGDRKHADSDQRQFMADLVHGGCRHADECSRAIDPDRTGAGPVPLPGQQPADQDQEHERDQGEGDA
ncbi:hypothetical protein FCG67_12700 [Rhodococcus oryzae]|uniref:Uncharacterized protein n=1 Tax=Rhodococcus oryzae TaxID=2571143 RepID=A0ABY2RL55_9NOCA|nr:hypothetical protein FCG67_12700 [Rhodococcus oryzae]